MAAITLQQASSTYMLQIPDADRTFFKSLVKKMGWAAKRTKTVNKIPAKTLAALEEVKSGKDAGIVDTSSLEAFIQSM